MLVEHDVWSSAARCTINFGYAKAGTDFVSTIIGGYRSPLPEFTLLWDFALWCEEPPRKRLRRKVWQTFGWKVGSVISRPKPNKSWRTTTTLSRSASLLRWPALCCEPKNFRDHFSTLENHCFSMFFFHFSIFLGYKIWLITYNNHKQNS